MWPGCRPAWALEQGTGRFAPGLHWFGDQTIRQVFLSKSLYFCQDNFFHVCSFNYCSLFFRKRHLSGMRSFCLPGGEWGVGDTIVCLLVALSCFLQKNFRSYGIEGATLTAFGHDLGGCRRASRWHSNDVFLSENASEIANRDIKFHGDHHRLFLRGRLYLKRDGSCRLAGVEFRFCGFPTWHPPHHWHFPFGKGWSLCFF